MENGRSRRGWGLALGCALWAVVGQGRAGARAVEVLRPAPAFWLVQTAGQATPPAPPAKPAPQPQVETTPSPEGQAPITAPRKPEAPMTRAQARELFGSVDTILKFASQDTGLPIRHSVKRRLTTRKAVEAYLVEKMREDKDTARVERSSIVLKKFGLLDRDFALRPFLLSLLKEQIAGFYDSKTKTVNLLDWIDPEEQKPVLAHELTHALQDQHVDLEKWGDQSIEGTPKDVADDNRHVARDEADTAREAVLEGQAMVTYMDWSLAPSSQSLRTAPDVQVENEDDGKPDPDSPELSRAPLVLKESLLFPYKDGLRFEQILLKDHGAEAAFAAVLDRPPGSSYEIMHPHAYEQHTAPALLTLPDLHPLLDAEYTPYDLGVMGALDVRMLGQAFGGGTAAADLAQGWNGGVYYAAQSRKAVAAGQGGSTGSIGLVYLSQWTSEGEAESFAKFYAGSLKRKYRQLRGEAGLTEASTRNAGASAEMRFTTEEGPVRVAVRGRQVFVSEGFAEPLAERLEERMMGPVRAAVGGSGAATQQLAGAVGSGELTAPLVRLFGAMGMMKAALRDREAASPRVY
ncbi:MAG TPA: hypothetical protein VGD62_12650 [Acidobacteriaceae bacterium]